MPLFDDLLGNLTTPPVGMSKRISSDDQPNWNDGNMDFSALLPGATLEMPVLEGPGVITHVWMTSHAGLIENLNDLSVSQSQRWCDKYSNMCVSQQVHWHSPRRAHRRWR